MPNMAKVIKEEIIRLAKKEAVGAVAAVKQDTVKLKKVAADLKRRVAQLERENRRLVAAESKRQKEAPTVAPEETQKARVTAKGIRSLRKRLRLSGADFAKLAGVTTQSVYNWESRDGALQLRDTTRAAVLQARGMGARDAKQRLEDMDTEAKATKAKTVPGKRRKRR